MNVTYDRIGTSDAAKMVGVSTQTIYNMISRDVIPHELYTNVGDGSVAPRWMFEYEFKDWYENDYLINRIKYNRKHAEKVKSESMKINVKTLMEMISELESRIDSLEKQIAKYEAKEEAVNKIMESLKKLF